MDRSDDIDDEKRKLNLGCGRNILNGWVNLDSIQTEGVDIVADLDKCENTQLPFEDNYFDEFLASHLIEHLHNPLPFMQELHRISKNNAKLVIKLPYGSSDDALEDPTHAKQYFLNSFGYFSQPYYWRADYGYRGDWQADIITLFVDKNRYAGKKAEDVLFEINTLRNIVREMVVKLRSIEPIRRSVKELQTFPKLDIRLV